MKKIFAYILVAAAAFSAVSCEEMLDSLSKNPVFELSGSTVYDGQKAFLGTTATCNIGWSTDNPSIVFLNHDENGKNCNAQFTLLHETITKVHVTATNLDDESVEPFTGEFTVAPWRLAVYQKVGSAWKMVSRTGEPYFVWTERDASGSSSFKVQMQALKADGTYEDIENVVYKMSLKDGFHKIDWQGTGLSDGQKGESTACSQEFTMSSAPAATLSITAKLGSKTHEVRILAK